MLPDEVGGGGDAQSGQMVFAHSLGKFVAGQSSDGNPVNGLRQVLEAEDAILNEEALGSIPFKL